MKSFIKTLLAFTMCFLAFQVTYAQVAVRVGNMQITEQDISTYIMASEYNAGYPFYPQAKVMLRTTCINSFKQNPANTMYIMRTTVQQAINKQAAIARAYQGRQYQPSASYYNLQSQLEQQRHNNAMRSIYNINGGYEEKNSGTYNFDNW